MKIKKIGTKNIILLSIILILLLLAGGTLAFFGWSSTDEDMDRMVDVTVSSGSGECSKLEDNAKLLIPVSSKEKGRVITINTKQTMAKNAVITWDLTVNKLNKEGDTTSGLKDESFKYELKNKTTGVSYGSGNFSGITDENNTITFSTTKETLDYNVDYEFVLYLWIDGIRFEKNSLNMASQDYDFNIVCNVTGVANEIDAPKYLSAHISNLYNQNDTAVSNGITYNRDTSNQLIEDLDGNIRYYGNDITYDSDGTTKLQELNNYIRFNCDIYPDTNCELWRIIGVFGDQVKLIRTSSLGQLSWHYDNSSSIGEYKYNNNWVDSSIKKLLNNAYINNNDTDYYNYSNTGPGGIKVDLDFSSTKTGIKPTTKDLIAETKYNLGGISGTSLNVNDIYNSERGYEVSKPTNVYLWLGKIGLPYLSDYGYAVDLNECKTTLNNYNNSDCNSNWLKNMFANNSTVTNFFITPSTKSANAVAAVTKNGNVGQAAISSLYNIYPVLYLNYDVVLHTVGDGSISSPYKLVIE